MWWGSDVDPEGSGGEGSKEPPPNQEDMKERYEQQQILLAQLKEMLKKSEQSSSVSREKVEEYASTLSEINARAKLSKIKRSENRKNDPEDLNRTVTTSTSKKSLVVTPAKEKINLLQQQLAENRAKIAQRDKNQKDIEEMFNQLKAQLDSQESLPLQEEPPVTLNLTLESTKDDLLNAIKCKDDHIIELTAKMQQLQVNVLDLQENIKEKDSVIDARTKAITLLSENLSKKGKNTLDMLDETKEQMRHMQQNFIQIEDEMKEENNRLETELINKEKLLDELRENNNYLQDNNNELKSANNDLEIRLTNMTTNLEKYQIDLLASENKIEDLLKLNEELEGKLMQVESEPNISQKTGKRGKGKNKKEISETQHVSKIAQLEKQIEEMESKSSLIEDVQSQGKEEVIKLQKQLDEMNKNMIKMKAQHKAKLKEIQKKFTPNEQADKISNLEQRLAELEEEKGNLQLRLVDLETNNKEKEYIADLENKIEDQKLEIESHICTIKTLELQITASTNEVSSLRNELSNLMHLENAQVCSEMTSVQLEEQLDKEVTQKKQIQDKYKDIIKENENLQEKILLLNKEKQELTTKLENYLQENIELIDRLEKLSAEKVSSAESIEIVESLTQQEKLEIEEYQKNMEFGTDKQPEEDPNEIQETKLTEVTSPSELLERIELFTVERREVMDKMDHLHVENQNLLSKCEKLEEKYDQLSIEKDSLVTKIDQLSAEKHDLQEKLNNFEANDNDALQKELTEHRALLENQKLQITSLQEELWDKPDNSLNTCDNNKILELENKILENEEEISFLQSNLEDNKTELISAAEKIAEYNKMITMKSTEIDILKNETDQLQQTIMELNSELENREANKQYEINIYSNQLAEFKNILTEHIEQLDKYEEESKQNSVTIESLNDQIEELNYKITENQHENQLKTTQLLAFASEKVFYETKIEHLEKELNEKNENFAESCRQLKDKCSFLENQIQTNMGSIEDIKIPFQTKIQQLETKNKELVEKMKKIAANLKKKSTICQELEGKLLDVTEKWEYETREKEENQKKLNEKEIKIDSLSKQIDEIQREYLELKQKFEEKITIENTLQELQSTIADKNKEIEDLKTEIYMIKSEAASSSKEVIQSLSTQVEEMKMKMETAQNAMEAKLQEKDMFIEHLEAECNKLKEKLLKLEEGFSTIMERRQILEEHAFDLKIQLEEKSSAYEEAFQCEDFLEKRLTALMEHDEMIEQKLKHSTNENQSLNDKLQSLVKENEGLNNKMSELHVMLQESLVNKEKLEQYENECTKLTTCISTIESEMKKVQNDYERKLNEKNFEIENMETELNSQLQELHVERKNILNRCEVLQDNLKEYGDNELLLNDEINQLQQKLILTEQQLEFKSTENLQLAESISNYLLKIEQLETMPNIPSAGNEFLQTEVEKLQRIIAEKDVDIENYQRQNMQLQMAASFSSTPTLGIFDTPESDLKTSLERSNEQLKELTNQYNQIQLELNHYQQMKENYNQLQEIYETAQQDIKNLKEINNNLQQELLIRKAAENNVKDIITTAEQTVFEEMINKTTAQIFKEPIQTNIFDNINNSSIDSQIVSQKTIDQDRSIPEFPPVNVEIFKDVVDNTAQSQAVFEEIIQPKKAYLCYPDPNKTQSQEGEAWGWGTEDEKIRESIESQIISMEQMKISPEEKKVFQKWEYGKVELPKQVTSNVPVDEKIQDPKSAFLCYPEPKNVDIFASEEDGWGCNPEEVKLEAEHRQSLSQIPVDHGKIEKLEERIHDLELERDRILEEVKTHQIRSGKLIKKFKQMKENYTKVVEQSKTNDFGLDMAIQDELNTQIKTLEKKLKETTEETAKDKAEIENYKQRLDVLQSANERMIEIKEKTDNEIQFLQFKNRELFCKLEQFEWGVDSPQKLKQEADLSNKQSDESNKKIQELQATIQELTLDNEEMQLILEEQRRLRIEAEKALINIPIPEGMKSKEDFIKLENEILQLNELNQITEEKTSKLFKENEELQAKSNHLQLNIENIVQEYNMMNQGAQMKLDQLQNENIELQNQFQMIYAENEKLKQQDIDLKQTELLQLKEQLSEVQQQKQNLETQYFEKQDITEKIQSEIATIKNEKQILEAELKEKEICIQNLNSKTEHLQSLIESLNERLQQFIDLQNEKDTCIERLNKQIIQLNDQILEKQTLDKELNEKEICVDNLNQRIAQIESEKLLLEQRIEEKQTLETEINEKNIAIQHLNNRIEQLESEKVILDQRIQEIYNIQKTDKTNDEKLHEMNQQLMTSLEALETKNKELNELINSLNTEKLETEYKMSSTIEELAQNWSERVDQRGNDVAESWKLHLETVENEFTQREAKLKMELNEILTKNEEIIHQNIELQKQVDILITDKQIFINDNNEIIQNLQVNLNTKQNEFYEISGKLQQLNTELETKNNEIKILSDASDLMKIKEIKFEETAKQLAEQISISKTFEMQLEIKNEMIKDFEEKLNNLNMHSVDDENQISDLRNIIENQVLKIEELKVEIEEKNNEYNMLVTEFDNFEQVYLKGEKPNQSLMENVNFATAEQILNTEMDQTKLEIDNANAPVNRAELDLALYMLHQRDVRCEELTVELMQLLEERDTLQLKLSNAIRLNEELRTKLTDTIVNKDSNKVEKSTGAIPKSTAIVLGATGTELATEATENIPTSADETRVNLNLDKKLSELKSIGYRDKTLKEDQEFRHNQQLSLMQQHRDLAANLPAEAAARLVDANYTLSRDVQSPSKVLLNWLWGRSTPKVNDV